jgi:hypothetical protein
MLRILRPPRNVGLQYTHRRPNDFAFSGGGLLDTCPKERKPLIKFWSEI